MPFSDTCCAVLRWASEIGYFCAKAGVHAKAAAMTVSAPKAVRCALEKVIMFFLF
jgi:hypothetical protein